MASDLAEDEKKAFQDKSEHLWDKNLYCHKKKLKQAIGLILKADLDKNNSAKVPYLCHQWTYFNSCLPLKIHAKSYAFFM